MEFLKKLGQILATGLELWSGFAPVFSTAVPNAGGVIDTVSKDLTEIGTIITNVEGAGAALGLPGPDKLKMAAPAVAQVIMSSALLSGHAIADTAKFQQGVNEIASGVADVLSSLSSATLQTTPKTTTQG